MDEVPGDEGEGEISYAEAESPLEMELEEGG